MSRKISTAELPKKKKSKPSVENNTTYLKMMLLKHNLETLSISSKSKVSLIFFKIIFVVYYLFFHYLLIGIILVSNTTLLVRNLGSTNTF